MSDDHVGEFENCEAAHSPGMIRISFGIYNTEEEVDLFLEILPEMIRITKEEAAEAEANGEDVYPEAF